MGALDLYQDRMNVNGSSIEESIIQREKRFLSQKLPKNLSYQSIYLNETYIDVGIIDDDKFHKKTLISLSPEDIHVGDIFLWNKYYWIVYENNVSAKNELYYPFTILKCNFLLKFLDKNRNIITQWSVIEDTSETSDGEYERSNTFTRGDSVIRMIVPKNENTVHFTRGKRFLIDDEDVTPKMSYIITKDFKINNQNSKEHGIYSFILTEDVSTEFDNHELGIADYYSNIIQQNCDTNIAENKNKEVWI